VPIDPAKFDELIRFAKKEGIGLTVVGPEDPLALGMVDAFQAEGLRIFGPSREAAQLEASKAFSKQVMRHADVPTADFRVFDHPEPARKYVSSREYVVLPDGTQFVGPFRPEQVVTEGENRYFIPPVGKRVMIGKPPPLVVKADGLAAGKGVIVCSST